jgi:anti-sigma factor RsiW
MSDMNCEEFWSTAPARELDEAHTAHLRECAACAGQWEAETKLSAGLRAMADASKNVAAPARVELRLVQAFRRQNGTVRRLPVAPTRQPWLAALGWTAAAAAMAIALLMVRSPQREPARPGRAPLIQLANTNSVEEAAYSDTASDSESEEGDVVRLEVPRSAMMALGYDVSPEHAAERVQAEVTLGPDGQARAVRFLEE